MRIHALVAERRASLRGTEPTRQVDLGYPGSVKKPSAGPSAETRRDGSGGRMQTALCWQ